VGRKTVLQHQRIVKAIAARDSAAAQAAITEHLTYLRGHIKALVGQENWERVG
jgi:DNA-binding GntR family transcriptional regulator